MDIEFIDIMEFISGNSVALPSADIQLTPACNIVVNIMNDIMSDTCFTGLSVEQQGTTSSIPSNYRSVVFPSFMIASKKHYVGILRDGELYTKGMNDIRRSGSTLSSIATQEFVSIVLTYADMDIIKIHLSKSCQENKWKVRSVKYLHLLNINVKYMGIRSNYVRVKTLHENSHRYVESNNISMCSPVDVNYYFNNIKTSLKLVTDALDIDFENIPWAIEGTCWKSPSITCSMRVVGIKLSAEGL